MLGVVRTIVCRPQAAARGGPEPADARGGPEPANPGVGPTGAAIMSSWRPGPVTALMAVAGSAVEAETALRAGADIVDLGAAGAAEIAAFMAAHRGVPVCADSGPASLVRDPEAAEASGATLIRRAPGRAGPASGEGRRAAGLDWPGDVVLQVPAGRLAGARRRGGMFLVDADEVAAAVSVRRMEPAQRIEPAQRTEPGQRTEPAEQIEPAIVAIAAVSAWLGAAIVRTAHPQPVRRALDMTASILGARPPARVVRGI
jgi:hypothetical protein